MPSSGYYAYLEDENGRLNTHMEGSGEAFAVLWGVADRSAGARMLTNVPVTDWGIPCQWPQYPEWMDYRRDDPDYYHNGMVWPFVQGYWAWAAATQPKNGDIVQGRKWIVSETYVGPDRRGGRDRRKGPQDRRNEVEMVFKNRRFGGRDRRKSLRRDEDRAKQTQKDKPQDTELPDARMK